MMMMIMLMMTLKMMVIPHVVVEDIAPDPIDLLVLGFQLLIQVKGHP